MSGKKLIFFDIKLLKLLSLVVFSISNLNAITLEKAVFQTLHTSPEIKDKAYSLDATQRERDMVLSAYYPKLHLSIGGGVASEKITPAYNEQSGEMVSRTDYSLIASMNVFNGFNTYHDVKSQEYRADAAKSYLYESKAAITMQIVESYINMMKQKAIVQITKENVASHEEIYEKLKEYTDSGIGKASDLGFALGRLTLAQVNAVVHENNFIQSKVVFETILGGFVEIDELEEPIFDYLLPEKLRESAILALDNNPSIKLGRDNIKSSYSNYKRSQSIYYPSVDIEIKKSLFYEAGAYEYSVNSSHAMLYLSYNLFNGFADKAMVENEFSIYMQNNQFLLLLKRDVTRKLATSWISSIKIEEQLKLLEKMRLFSKKTLEDYYKEFGIGRRTLLDIINVKNDFNNARQSYESAKYDLLLSKFRILDALGNLLDYFLAKADNMQLSLDEDFIENKSVYEIIKQMSDRLEYKEDFVSYDEGNYTSFDALMEEHGTGDDLDLENQEEWK